MTRDELIEAVAHKVCEIVLGAPWPYSELSKRSRGDAELYIDALDALGQGPKRVAKLEKALRGAIGALEFSRDYHSDLGNEEQAFAQDRLDAALAALKGQSNEQ